jgi:hypothetical protein
VRSDLVKISPHRIRDVVANIHEVEELFRDTRYATYLDAEKQTVVATSPTTDDSGAAQ